VRLLLPWCRPSTADNLSTRIKVKGNSMKQIIATLAGWLIRNIANDWALRNGLQPWTASLLSWLAGATTSAIVLQA